MNITTSSPSNVPVSIPTCSNPKSATRLSKKLSPAPMKFINVNIHKMELNISTEKSNHEKRIKKLQLKKKQL